MARCLNFGIKEAEGLCYIIVLKTEAVLRLCFPIYANSRFSHAAAQITSDLLYSTKTVGLFIRITSPCN